jgi:hypothetical protein
LNLGDLVAGITFVPRNITIRVVILAGIVAPWVWLVAIDRVLSRKR